MSIHFDGSSKLISKSFSSENLYVTHPQSQRQNGLADVRSSVSSHEPLVEMSFFGWLGKKIEEIFQSLLSCLGLNSQTKSAETLLEPTEIARARFNQRIGKGSEIITQHLNTSAINNFVPMQVVVVVVIQYNNQLVSSVGMLSDGKSAIIQRAIAQLRGLLGNDLNKHREDARLNIETQFYNINDFNSFDLKSCGSWVQFPNCARSGNSSEAVDGIDRIAVDQMLRTVFPNHFEDERIRVLNAIINRN